MTCCPAATTEKSTASTQHQTGLSKWVNQVGDDRQSLDLLVPRSEERRVGKEG